MVNHSPPRPRKVKDSANAKDGQHRKPAAKAGAKSRRQLDIVQSKQDLLAHLTRQAEENTKILERERAQLLAQGIEEVETQTLKHRQHHASYDGETVRGLGQAAEPYPYNGHGASSDAIARHPIRQHAQAAVPQHRLARGQPEPRLARLNAPAEQVGHAAHRHARKAAAAKVAGGHGPTKNHVFLNQPIKVVDPNQVPGLGNAGGPATPMRPVQMAGNAGASPNSPFAGHLPDHLKTPGPGATFPDSPSFYPGMVFGIPARDAADPTVTMPRGSPGGPEGHRFVQLIEPNYPTPAAYPPAAYPPAAYPPELQLSLPPEVQNGGLMFDQPHALHHHHQQQFQSQRSPGPQRKLAFEPAGSLQGPGQHAIGEPHLDPRRLQEQKQMAYRQELEEQIRLKHQMKEQEAAADRRAAATEAARIAAHPPPWDPTAQSMRRGGGGEPLRDPYGNPVTNLRHGPGWQPGGPSPTGHTMQQHMPMGADTTFGKTRNQPTLTIQVPSPSGELTFNNMPPGMPPTGMGNPYETQPTMGPGHPGNISPGGGNRKFMHAMNELRAGPSEEQRRAKDVARLQLQRDLEDQIRQKKEREARQKAEEARARAKEEAELQAYYDKLNTQKEAGQQQQQNHHHQQQQQQQQPPHSQNQPHKDAWSNDQGATAAQQNGPRPRRAKRIIDADWLPPPGSHQQPPVQPAGQLHAEASGGVGAGPARELLPEPLSLAAPAPRYGRRSTVDAGHSGELPAAPMQPGAPNRQYSMDSQVSSLLQQLQHEQVRLREDFAKQKQLVDQLAHDASSVMADRDKAWQELHRVQALLNDNEAQSDQLEQGDALDQFVVSTHLVPRNVNNIPDRLTTPLEANWVAESDPLLVHREEMLPLGHYHSGLQGTGHHHFGLEGFDDLADELDSLDQLQRAVMEHDLAHYGADHRWSGPGNDGLYRPMSKVAGPPSQLPRPPVMSSLGLPPPHHHNLFAPDDEFAALCNAQPLQWAGQFDGADAGHPHGRAQQMEGRGGNKPPQSPAILRGDHLPSPTKVTRMGAKIAGTAANTRSGRGSVVAQRQVPAEARKAAAAKPPPRPQRRGELLKRTEAAQPPARNAKLAGGQQQGGAQGLEGQHRMRSAEHGRRANAVGVSDAPLAGGNKPSSAPGVSKAGLPSSGTRRG